jgi:hypothetical protein
MTSPYVKYEDFVIIIFQDNELKFSTIQRLCDLDLWPGDPNQKESSTSYDFCDKQ